MYSIVPEIELHSSLNSSTETTDSAECDDNDLGARIMHICKGHLRYSFQANTFLAIQTWPRPSVTADNPNTPAVKMHGKAFVGSLQILKLYEFAQFCKGQICIKDDLLQSCATLWLDALEAERDLKSELWYKDTRKLTSHGKVIVMKAPSGFAFQNIAWLTSSSSGRLSRV